MPATLGVVFPVFALIFLGWAARRRGILGEHAVGELNRFVVWLALPALLFDIMANVAWSSLWQPGFLGAFGLGGLLLFGAILALRVRTGQALPEATIDSLNAAYPNTGYMGFPLCVIALGPASLPLVTLATILTVCVLFAVAIASIELGLQAERRPWRLAGRLARTLAGNPLLLAPVLGALTGAVGLVPSGGVATLLKLLGAAAPPCALVALGVFLAQQGLPQGAERRATLALVAVKLLVMPAFVWLLATVVFRLPPLATHTAVLLAALPTGTGPFMLAEYYRRGAAITSASILVSTVASVVTVSAYLAWIG